MQSLLPVTPDILYHRLLKLGLTRILSPGVQASNEPWRVGLCVSGGPDSMALAYLLRNISDPLPPHSKIFAPHAFIIDHGARDGSHEEAVWVKAQLEKMGIPAHVRKLHWPTGTDPRSMNGFEKEARVKRYRELAYLARHCKVADLFTGHHKDDQIETVMLRLYRDHAINPFSFHGMSTTVSIPCCETVWHANPYSVPYRTPGRSAFQEPPTAPMAERLFLGIRLHRPLLVYEKSELLATCRRFDIPYIQDQTNLNPQLTPRNAIRHLRTFYNLPRALRQQALLDRLTKVETLHLEVEKHASAFRHEIRNFSMYSETGVLTFRLKLMPYLLSGRQLRGFSYFLSRMAALVSALPIGKRATILNRDLTEKLLDVVKNGSRGSSHTEETIAFHKIACRLSVRKESDASAECSFLLSRQPLSRNEGKLLVQSFSTSSESDERGALFHSERLLWDNRFWIGISTNNKDLIGKTVVRAYTAEDAFAVRKTLKQKGLSLLEEFDKVLHNVAPGHSRYTLPILLVNNAIIGFPTLNFVLCPSPSIHWHIEFARDLRSIEFLFPKLEATSLQMEFNQLSVHGG